MKRIKLFEDWDPSMSMDPSAPFNQPDMFIETYEPAMIKLEELLGKEGHVIPENLWELLSKKPQALEAFDSAVEEKFGQLFQQMYVSRHDRVQDEPVYTEEYNRVVKEVRDRKTLKDKMHSRHLKNEQDMALTMNIAEKHAKDFWPIYDKAMNGLKNNESLVNEASYDERVETVEDILDPVNFADEQFVKDMADGEPELSDFTDTNDEVGPEGLEKVVSIELSNPTDEVMRLLDTDYKKVAKPFEDWVEAQSKEHGLWLDADITSYEKTISFQIHVNK